MCVCVRAGAEAVARRETSEIKLMVKMRVVYIPQAAGANKTRVR